MVLNGVFVTSVGLNNNTEYYKLKSTGSDLDRVSSDDTRSAENDWIGADTDPQYRIDASLLTTLWEKIGHLTLYKTDNAMLPNQYRISHFNTIIKYLQELQNTFQ